MNSCLQSIFTLFICRTDIHRTNLRRLIKDSVRQLGLEDTLAIMEQWRVLASKLNTSNKLSALGQKNHRRLIIEFMKNEAVQLYRSSYFNNARIDEDYLTALRQVGPYQFAQILTIVSKLNLIFRHCLDRMPTAMSSENYIHAKIGNILTLCASKKRSLNNNLSKFKAIVQFTQRVQLVKEMGKLLRQCWVQEKKKEETVPQTVLIDSNIIFPGLSVSQMQISFDIHNMI